MRRFGLVVGLLAAALLTGACAMMPSGRVESSSPVPASSPEFTGEPGHYEFPENPKGPGIPPARIH